MCLRVVWLVLALSGTGSVGSRSAYICPQVCRCTAERFECNRDTQLSSSERANRAVPLLLTNLPMKQVHTHSFKDLINVNVMVCFFSCLLTVTNNNIAITETLLYFYWRSFVRNIKSLRVIEKGAFTDLPRLENLEMADNMRIDTIPANCFHGITEEYVNMNLWRNGFKEIHSHAFNGTNLDTLVLRDNKYLRVIEEDAFEGASGPISLDVSSTALSQLPPKGLRQVKFLRAISAFALKSLPDLQSLSELVEAELTYPSHCCAFNEWKRKQRAALKNKTFCDLQLPGDAMSLFNEIIDQYPDLEWEMGCLENTSVKCEPKQDAFNPCEDLLGFSFLRWLTWIITIFAVAGNLAVLVILLISHRKLTISRFLMCNLAFADLCMGLYLMLIAFMDHHSRHEYYNHATDWQTGPGCGVAGFLTVFSSELSVYTLTVISLERWHTITNAMRVNKRLRMHHVAAMMGTGWGFSLVVALLPLVGVSSYSKVSVCLPMDIDTLGSQLYVVVTLILNVVAFLVVCYCYICIYLSVHNPEHSTRHGDTKIAKRMAVLIFTDFLCMAPISFFAISAALYMPLITVSHSKILLILFYPINSLCNPFLYTIFTRAFRKDMYLLVTRCGFCHNNADFYRSQTHASHLTSTQKPSNSKPKLLFNGNHIKVRDCFLNKGTT
uniref:Lutropin-choriogonadotropic hormone receptor-like n=1 Tax=Gouania willdenowi TaxID=441366 RepID=A0A8C5HJL9_GOUWI